MNPDLKTTLDTTSKEDRKEIRMYLDQLDAISVYVDKIAELEKVIAEQEAKIEELETSPNLAEETSHP